MEKLEIDMIFSSLKVGEVAVMMVVWMSKGRTTTMAISSCGCGARVSIMTGDREINYNFVDEESIAGIASWSDGKDNFIFSRASRRSWESNRPLKVVI
jgi:hypothetical protein